MWQSFNVNHYVRVKLTEEGRRLLIKRHHDLMCAVSVEPWPYDPPKEDADGWSKWQTHNLMEALGSACVMGRPVPFETEIQFEVNR
jgi:hypothetical protein